MSISDSELNAIRDDLSANYLPNTATIKRQTAGTILADGSRGTAGTSTSTAACAIAQASGAIVAQLAGRITDKQYYTLTVPYDTDILNNDIITIESVDYSIVRLWDDHSFNISKRAVIEAVK